MRDNPVQETPERAYQPNQAGRQRNEPQRGMLQMARQLSKWWWIWLVMGALWIIASLIILQFQTEPSRTPEERTPKRDAADGQAAEQVVVDMVGYGSPVDHCLAHHFTVPNRTKQDARGTNPKEGCCRWPGS